MKSVLLTSGVVLAGSGFTETVHGYNGQTLASYTQRSNVGFTDTVVKPWPPTHSGQMLVLLILWSNGLLDTAVKCWLYGYNDQTMASYTQRSNIGFTDTMVKSWPPECNGQALASWIQWSSPGPLLPMDAVVKTWPPAVYGYNGQALLLAVQE